MARARKSRISEIAWERAITKGQGTETMSRYTLPTGTAETIVTMSSKNITTHQGSTPIWASPAWAMSLCVTAYLPVSQIPAAVGALGLRCDWVAGTDRSQMFIAGDPNANLWVVIRGTDFTCLNAWLDEDFNVDNTKALGSLPDWPTSVAVPAGAVISGGAFSGVSDLLALVDAGTGLTAVGYLSSVAANTSRVTITGHSLGGTLAPPLFAYLNAVLNGGAFTSTMSLFTFAGLTAGGSGFNAYLNGLFASSAPWRFQNDLDIAPFMFDSLSSIKSIYAGQGLEIDPAADLALDGLFLAAMASGITYEQPQAGVSMVGTFQAGSSWPDEAVYQHHATTYEAMVDAAFPPSRA